MSTQEILQESAQLLIYVAAGLQIKTWTYNTLKWATRKRAELDQEER